MSRDPSRKLKHRSRRGFGLLEMAVVVLLVGIVTAISYSSFTEPTNAAKQSYVDQLLVSVDVEVRSRARSTGALNPAQFLHEVVGATNPNWCPFPTGDIPWAPHTPTVPEECTFDTPRQLRVAIDEVNGVLAVARYGVCGVLHVNPRGADQGRIAECDPELTITDQAVIGDIPAPGPPTWSPSPSPAP